MAMTMTLRRTLLQPLKEHQYVHHEQLAVQQLEYDHQDSHSGVVCIQTIHVDASLHYSMSAENTNIHEIVTLSL